MITYNRILAAGLLMGSSVVAMADGKFSLSKIELAPGETRTVTVYLQNDSVIRNMEVHLQLPAGLSFVQNSFWKTENMNKDISAARIQSDNTGRTWRVMTMNIQDTPLFNPSPLSEKTAIFTFDVKADENWKVGSGDGLNVDSIKIIKGVLTEPDYTEEPVLDVNGNEAKQGNGTIAKASATKNVISASDVKLTLDGEDMVEDDMELLPTQPSKKITVYLDNSGVTARNTKKNEYNETVPGDDSNISLVGGTLVLPKGVFYKKNTGAVSQRAAGGIMEPIASFEPVMKDGEFVTDEDGCTFVNFSVGRVGGSLRGLEGELFSFEVFGRSPYAFESETAADSAAYDIREGAIVIKNITMSIASGTAGLQQFPNEVLTVNVTNSNQISKEDFWTAVQQDVRDSLETNKSMVNQDAAYFPKTAQQIADATEAVEAFEAAIDEAYKNGILNDNTDVTEAKQNALDEIGKILTAYYDEYSEGQKAIYDDYITNDEHPLRALTEDEQPYRNYPGITEINDPQTGSYVVAKKALKDAYEAAVGKPEMLDLDLAPIAAEIDSIIEVFEDSVAKAKGLYESEGHEFALTQSTILNPAEADADVAKYPAVAAIIGDEGTFAKAKKAAKEKWEAAEEAGTAYDVDFADDFALLESIQEEYTKALADADSSLQAHEAIFNRWANQTLPVVGDSVRNYPDILAGQADFEQAILAIEQKYEEKVNANELVNYDFAADTALIESIMKDFDEVIEDAREKAAANQQAYDETFANYSSEQIDWKDKKEIIENSNNIPTLVAALENAESRLKSNLVDAKGLGRMAGYDDNGKFVANPLQAKIDLVKAAFEALQKAIDESVEEFAILDSLETEVMPGLDTKLTEEEIAKAKVVNPAEVSGSNQVSTLDQDAYDELIEELGELNNQLDSDIESWEQQFQAGELTKAELDELLATVDDAIAAIEKEAMKKIVAHLITYQRGDVGGDGRWTTNDYARIRRMILDASEPEISSWKKTGTGQYTKIEIDAENSEDAYTFARYDVNRDGQINVGDAQAALNFTFYGDEFNHDATYEAARDMSSTEDNLTANAQGNVIAVALQSGRQYSAFQMDVVLPEGMTITNETLGLRNEGFTLSSNDVNGVHRILVTSAQGKAFEGNEGDVLYLEVAGNGNVEFKNVIFADVNAATTQFQLDAVATGEATGINGVKAQNGVMDAIYNVGGRMMNSLKKGINIIRRADGDTKKVIK